MKTAIKEWPFLEKNQEKFATNYIDAIVAWKSLDDLIPNGEQVKDEPNSIEWGPLRISDGKNTVPVRFKKSRSINTHGIHRYATADPNYEDRNFDDIAWCLNIVISKSFNEQVHKLSSNKFLVKQAHMPLFNADRNESDSLEMLRGYYYNVKPGMGNIILNFNISTSAVFRPILVADFLNRNNTFTKDKVGTVLNGNSVYVDLDRRDPDAIK